MFTLCSSQGCGFANIAFMAITQETAAAPPGETPMIRPPAAALIVLIGMTAWTGTARAQAADAAPVEAAPVVAAASPAPPPPVTPLARVDAVFAADGVTVTDGGKSVLF